MMSAESQPSTDGAPSSALLAQERARLIAEWMPALLHRLNNAASVVLGITELLRAARGQGASNEDHFELVQSQSRVIVAVLRLFGSLAIPRDEPAAAVDLHVLVGEPLELIDLVHRTSLSEQLRPRRGLTVVRSDPDGLRLLVHLALFHAAVPRPPRVVRSGPPFGLRIAGEPGRVRMALLCSAAPEPADSLARVEQTLRWQAESLGGRWRARAWRGGRAWRIWVPARTALG
jgi:predicted nucleotidyltransferase